jgi:hypothetical protein
MKQSSVWLLALLSILTLAATSTLAMAEEGSAHLSGNIEVGVTGVDTKDNHARVNEYGKYSADDDGLSLAPSLSLESLSNGVLLGIEAEVKGKRDQAFSLELDASRIFKFETNYQVFEHWKDHDNLEHMGATMTGDVNGDQPRVASDLTWGGSTPASLEAAQARYYLEMDNDYIVKHTEWENEASLTLPALPNVTFHAGLRIEEREGSEQATTTSKCGICHVSADSKGINESTEDFTFGVTGKFGILTVEYEYLDRDFDEDGPSAAYSYKSSTNIRAGIEDEDQLLYSGLHDYKVTPDSEKDSHMLEARVDLPQNTVISASYVTADIESDKEGEAGTYSLDTGTLTSEFDSFFLKGATRFGALRLSMRGGTYEIDGPEYDVTFPDRDDMLIADGGQSSFENQTFDNPEHFESAESREVTEFGIDGVYRLARATTLRLGYEYEKIDRDEAELGETETNTYKIAVQSRLNKQLSGRVSYEYQDIDDPFQGAKTGIAQGIGVTDPAYPGLEWLYTDDFRLANDPDSDNPANQAVYYWNSVYPNRTLETSMAPDEVQQVKFSSTWSPATNAALTVFARYRDESNDDVSYDQKTFVPGLTFYYAPNSKMNLTMSYTFNKQETENQMCVGWYHG